MNSNTATGHSDPDDNQRLVKAMQCYQAGDLNLALDQCLNIIADDPKCSSAQHLLSAIYLQAGQADTAHQYAAQAVANAPSNAGHHNGLGLALQALEKFVESQAAFEKAIELQPELPDFHCNKASVLIDQSLLDKAIDALNEALRIEPNHINSLANKALILQKFGRTREGMKCLDQAFRLNPESVDIAHNRLMMLNYCPDHSASEVLDHTKAYWGLLEKRTPAIKPVSHQSQPSQSDRKPLRIGYVSGDLFNHPVGRILLPILKCLNHQDFQYYLYANNRKDDHVSEGMRSTGCAWRSILALSDDDAATQILEDEIDILVDLSGHTDGNRLGIFRRKPAPIQMTWLGYVATTGLPEIDYIIADDFVLPKDDEHCFTETPLRLPYSHLCYSPPLDVARPQRSPNRFECSTVFGSFNHLPKINEEVAETWSKILQAVDNSKLLMKSLALSNDSTSRAILSLFAEFGIPADRLILVGETSFEDHIGYFRSVDIALDPFPYGGMMTTLETIWLGVPVVTYAGHGWASQVSASILSAAGMPHLIAESIEQYIETAIALAHNKTELTALQDNAKILIESSPLCDVKRFTKSLERLYQTAWQTYCQSPPTNST